jgi:hypothetical protein
MEIAEGLCGDYTKLLAVGISNICTILSYPSLKIRSEYFVEEIVRDHFRFDCQCFSAFEHVLIDQLSFESIADFISVS